MEAELKEYYLPEGFHTVGMNDLDDEIILVAETQENGQRIEISITIRDIDFLDCLAGGTIDRIKKNLIKRIQDI